MGALSKSDDWPKHGNEIALEETSIPSQMAVTDRQAAKKVWFIWGVEFEV